jgi:hypothetical protein
MPVSLPERTVDAWVVAYLVARISEALLWAPTQRQTPDNDIASSLPARGRLFVLENKAPYTDGQHEFNLPVRQMWNYLRHPQLRARTFYVLPCPPFPVTEVPGAPGAIGKDASDLVPTRAQARCAGHSWTPSTGCEAWFRVIPVIDLWTHCLGRQPPRVSRQAASQARTRR